MYDSYKPSPVADVHKVITRSAAVLPQGVLNERSVLNECPGWSITSGDQCIASNVLGYSQIFIQVHSVKPAITRICFSPAGIMARLHELECKQSEASKLQGTCQII